MPKLRDEQPAAASSAELVSENANSCGDRAIGLRAYARRQWILARQVQSPRCLALDTYLSLGSIVLGTPWSLWTNDARQPGFVTATIVGIAVSIERWS